MRPSTTSPSDSASRSAVPVSSSPRSSTTDSRRTRRDSLASAGAAGPGYVPRHRTGRRALPEGVRRADQRAPRLSRRGGHRARSTGCSLVGGTIASRPRPNGSAALPTLAAKVDELARILDEDGYLATAEAIDRRRVPRGRAQLRHHRGRPPLRPGVHQRDRLHPRRAARRASGARQSHRRGRSALRLRHSPRLTRGQSGDQAETGAARARPGAATWRRAMTATVLNPAMHAPAIAIAG